MARQTVRSGGRKVHHRGDQAGKGHLKTDRDAIFGEAGDVWLCGIKIAINTCPDWGGSFKFPGNQDSRGQINIGLRPRAWWVVQDTIMHELFEFSATWMKLRFHSDSSLVTDGSEGAMFVMSHTQMTEVIKGVANAWAPVEKMVKQRWAKCKIVEGAADVED